MTTMAEALATIAGVDFNTMTEPHAERVAGFLQRAVVEIMDREAQVTQRERAVSEREAQATMRENNADARAKALDSAHRLKGMLTLRPKGTSWLRRS